MCEYGVNIGNMNMKGTMSVVPLALMIQLMDQKINSALYVEVLNRSMNNWTVYSRSFLVRWLMTLTPSFTAIIFV